MPQDVIRQGDVIAQALQGLEDAGLTSPVRAVYNGDGQQRLASHALDERIGVLVDGGGLGELEEQRPPLENLLITCGDEGCLIWRRSRGMNQKLIADKTAGQKHALVFYLFSHLYGNQVCVHFVCT